MIATKIDTRNEENYKSLILLHFIFAVFACFAMQSEMFCFCSQIQA